MDNIILEAERFIQQVENLENINLATVRQRQDIESKINRILQENKNNKEALDIGLHAIDLLRQVSDQTVQEAYKFLEDQINNALARMFTKSIRRIKIQESTRGVQYPQLNIMISNGNGRMRTLKVSGHGVAQIVSLLSILCLIVITGARRILVLDEVLSGVSQKNLMIIDQILKGFTSIGFQFIINDHGFIPKGSHVYHLEAINDVSRLKREYISNIGVYRQSTDANAKTYDYLPEQVAVVAEPAVDKEETVEVDTGIKGVQPGSVLDI